MRHPSLLRRLRTPMRVRHAYSLGPRGGTRDFQSRASCWKRPVVLVIRSGLLLLVGALLGQIVQPRAQDHPLLHVVPQITVVVQEDVLPPVMQRIAQCESRGQHFTKDGQVVRGKRNPQDLGLFQINRVVWGKKAEELGYDIRTPEGNERMARYLFAQYGSVPWQTSAACWSHTG